MSYETAGQEIVRLADHVITGEADLKFAEVCRALLAGEPLPKIIPADLPALDRLALPYELYTDARSRAPRPLRGGVARLSIHLRVLPLFARRARAGVCRSSHSSPR